MSTLDNTMVKFIYVKKNATMPLNSSMQKGAIYFDANDYTIKLKGVNQTETFGVNPNLLAEFLKKDGSVSIDLLNPLGVTSASKALNFRVKTTQGEDNFGISVSETGKLRFAGEEVAIKSTIIDDLELISTEQLVDDIYNNTSNASNKAATPNAVYKYVKARIGTLYRPAGTKTKAELENTGVGKLAIELNLGNVYNASEDFVTTSDFLEWDGTPKQYYKGSNIVVIKNPVDNNYKLDILGGLADFSNYALSTHEHGDISNTGTIPTGKRVDVLENFQFVMTNGNSKIVRTKLTIGNATNTFLRNDGTWGDPLTDLPISNWNNAYNWGDHSLAGYLKADGSVSLHQGSSGAPATKSAPLKFSVTNIAGTHESSIYMRGTDQRLIYKQGSTENVLFYKSELPAILAADEITSTSSDTSAKFVSAKELYTAIDNLAILKWEEVTV